MLSAITGGGAAMLYGLGQKEIGGRVIFMKGAAAGAVSDLAPGQSYNFPTLYVPLSSYF